MQEKEGKTSIRPQSLAKARCATIQLGIITQYSLPEAY
jgi:hypothetical protein